MSVFLVGIYRGLIMLITVSVTENELEEMELSSSDELISSIVHDLSQADPEYVGFNIIVNVEG